MNYDNQTMLIFIYHLDLKKFLNRWLQKITLTQDANLKIGISILI